MILAQVFVALPFLVLSVEGALRASDRRYEEAASTLGARPVTVFRRITLPLIGPGIAAGAVLAWARALGEFGATITFAGNFPGTTRTMPLRSISRLETDPDAALLLSVLLLGVSVAVLGPAAGTLGDQVVAELSADLGVRRGDFTLDLGLEIAAGRGRCSARSERCRQVHCAAGAGRTASDHVRPDHGRWAVVADAASGIHRAPHERPIGVVFQDYLLFPHLPCLTMSRSDSLVRGVGQGGGAAACWRCGSIGWASPTWRMQAADRVWRAGAAGGAGPRSRDRTPTAPAG